MAIAAIVSASKGVIGPLISKLTSLVVGEYKLQRGVKRNIRFLIDELTTMNAFLETLETWEKLDPLVLDWRNKICELTYDIEDCIDLFMHKLNRDDVKASFVQKTADSIKSLWSRHKIAKIIEELKVRVTVESERHLRYKFDEYSGNASKVEIDPRLLGLYAETKKLVGVEGRMEKIMEWFMDDSEQRKMRVMSIMGFGGLGKSTLANELYAKVERQFQYKVFVTVSRKPNLRKILSDMLEEGKLQHDALADEWQMINKLRAHLQNKSFFVIIDDIWSISHWEAIKAALPDNDHRSKIITTTRNADVAKSCCSGPFDCIYNIQPLCEKDAQKLFFKRLFGSELCPPHLDVVCSGIIKKCCGVPLALLTVASLLSRKASTKNEFEQVYNSIGSVFSSEKMNDIIMLSYHDLPSNLKTCLLYFTMFPEDFCVSRYDLLWMWVAEGFVTEQEGQNLEETANIYLTELINRGLVEAVDVSYDGRAKACKIHDMILDIIRSISQTQNFVTCVSGHHKLSPENMRRVSFQSNRVTLQMMQEIMKNCLQVRSLVIIQELHKTPPLSKYRCLRVLCLEDTRGHLSTDNIRNIGSFVQLKFLKINCYGVTLLPDDIGKLYNLETLNIAGCMIETLPPSIGSLQNLVRLIADLLCQVMLPSEVGDLQNLEMLSPVVVYNSENFLDQIRRLTKIRVLEMILHRQHSREGFSHQDTSSYRKNLELSVITMGKHNIKSLDIYIVDYGAADDLIYLLCRECTRLEKLVFSGRITRVPQNIAYLLELSHLELRLTTIDQEQLCLLGAIPSLLFIELILTEAPLEKLCISTQLFVSVKEFAFSSWGEGGLRFLCQPDAMQSLKRLCILFMAKEADSHLGFEFIFNRLASLELLEGMVQCEGATKSNVEAAEAALHNAVTINHGRPTVIVKRYKYDLVVEDGGMGARLQGGLDKGEDHQEES